MSQAKSICLCFIKLVYDCIQWKVDVSVKYDGGKAKAYILPCPIVEGKYVFTRFKTLKDRVAL